MLKNGRITMQTDTTLESLFEDFLMSRKVEGAVEKTIQTYKQQFRAVSKHFPINWELFDQKETIIFTFCSSFLFTSLPVDKWELFRKNGGVVFHFSSQRSWYPIDAFSDNPRSFFAMCSVFSKAFTLLPIQ